MDQGSRDGRACGWEGMGRLREVFWREWRGKGGVEEWSGWIDRIHEVKENE